MWERYRSTFKVIQFTVVLMSTVIYFISGRALLPALMFFIMMQGFALIGAAWASRLKNLIERRATRLPL